MNAIVGFLNIFKRFKTNLRCKNCQVDSIHGSLLSQFIEIQPIVAWKFGHLYQCSRCSCYWFLPEHKQYIARIHDNLLPLAHHWNQTPLTLNSLLLSALTKIGGVEGSKDCIAIPCAVKNVSGEYHDKAIVLISKQPPYFWYNPQIVHWADELVAINPSPFALPIDVRRASSQKREISMGFAPVGVVDNKGTEYTLPCESRFFDSNNVKGEEVSLSGREKKWKKTVLPSPAKAFYFVDWFDGCEKLLLK
jgi:hypothetical protein